MNRILAALLAMFFVRASVEAADKIRVGYPEPSASFLSLPVGQTGFFQKEGIQPELIRIRSTAALAALVSGEIDYQSVIPSGIAAAIRGVPVKIVACYTSGIAAALIVRPEFKSVQDLRGKTIGLNSFGGGLESTARLMFKRLGLDPDKDLKFLAAGGIQSRLLAMKQGLIAATLGSPPADYLAKKIGYVVLATAYELFHYPSSGLIVNAKRIKEKPDEIKRMIKAGIRTNRYISHNREGTIQTMMPWMRADEETAAASYDSTVKTYSDDLTLPEDGLRLLIDEAKKAAKIDHDVPFDQVADFSLLKEAQRELGINEK